MERQTRGSRLTVILLDNNGKPTDIKGYTSNFKLPEIETEVTKTNFAGYTGQVPRVKGDTATDFSIEMESCNSELRAECIKHQGSRALVSIMVTAEMESIEDGEDKVSDTYTMTGRITKSPTIKELNGSDFSKSEIMMAITSYQIDDESGSSLWTITEGWKRI